MQEVFDKIKQKLVLAKHVNMLMNAFVWEEKREVLQEVFKKSFEKSIAIVDEVAEEYVHDTKVGKNNGWIPCSERLPEIGVDVLVCDEVGFIDLCYLDGTHWWDIEGRKYGLGEYCVWMPLPEPYKKEV
jgi:hypothetical protein